ncbi:1-phosphofructokinase family hexose kinase [Lacisediminihabitans sp. H27-G8]|uniref:1-phosphofructokinase family hexose kinase n=1 Tax=Lacisediminihabitans sp. H27-G8 TaxID=3111909 RepID=UPI0038FD02B6
MITFVALSPSVDVTYLVDEFTEGGTFRPTTVLRVAGGKALNAARAARVAGASVRAVAILGGTSGDFIGQQLAVAGVPLEAVDAVAETRTCVSIASAASGLLTELYEHPSAISTVELAELRRLLGHSAEAGWWAISGGMPSSFPVGELAGLVRLGHSLGQRVAIDTHGAALATALDAGPDLVKVNRREAAELLGTDADADAFDLAHRIRSVTGGRVVITDGAKGSMAVDGSSRWLASWSGAIGRFPVGSGDSYLGGLLAGLDRGDSFEDALRLGSGAATANALVPGAGVFTVEDATRIASEVVVAAG